MLLFSITEAGSPTNWAVLGEFFGRKNFGQLFGFARLACFPVVLIAPVFVGWWYDQYNSYTFPLWIFTVGLVLSALAFSLLRRPKSNETLITPGSDQGLPPPLADSSQPSGSPERIPEPSGHRLI